MAKPGAVYVCQACGVHHPKWMGKCEDCGAWNSLQEESLNQIPKGLDRLKASGRRLEILPLEGQDVLEGARYESHVQEFDRVLGGGMVPGSVLLVGGDPGIGKSTLLLQITAALSHHQKCLYISGEEGIAQIRLRAKRLGIASAPLGLASSTNLRDILATLETEAPKVLIIDSIQTMFIDSIEAAPGTVSQVRMCTHELIQLAKRKLMTVLLVGHVTKEGTIAGPRVLEHMVDTVLYFEGERGHQFRILRGVKNRFGPTDEIGVFEMTQQGLQEVSNPSSLFLPDAASEASGTAIFAGMEGTRPLLVEVQSLVAPSAFGVPRRTVVGWDSGRLSMVLAVLETRGGLALSGKDIFLNIAGGLKIQEPAADLAVAAALIAAASGEKIPSSAVVFGEMSLSGDIRSVAHADLRLKEAAKLGFDTAYMPPISKKKADLPQSLTCKKITHIRELVEAFQTKGD